MTTDFIGLNPLILAVLGYFFTLILIKPVLKFLYQVNSTGTNYQGQIIPVGAGLSFVWGAMLALGTIQLSMGLLNKQALYLLIGLVTMSLLGILDDLVGDRNSSGLKGHLLALTRGQLTTGSLKAVGGGLLGLFLAAPLANNFYELLLNGLLIALAINLINLLDLRPGRAIKGFYLAFVLTVLLSGGIGGVYQLIWLFPVAGGLLAYASYDLTARGMMGDTGSNCLGLTFGLGLVWGLPGTSKVIALLALVVIHLYAEYYSISRLIESRSWLRKLDLLGR